jgi:hypothetical protein
MYVCTYVCTHAHMYVRTYVCMYICTYMYTSNIYFQFTQAASTILSLLLVWLLSLSIPQYVVKQYSSKTDAMRTHTKSEENCCILFTTISLTATHFLQISKSCTKQSLKTSKGTAFTLAVQSFSKLGRWLISITLSFAIMKSSWHSELINGITQNKFHKDLLCPKFS